MTDMERKTFCSALSRYGAQAQITMAFEEIADVGIMLDQMAIVFDVEDAVAEQRSNKVQRLRERIEKDD